MATRYGFKTFEWLREHGWKPDEMIFEYGKMNSVNLEDCVFGDRHVIDPVSGNKMDVYTAAKLQQERSGEYPAWLENNSR